MTFEEVFHRLKENGKFGGLGIEIEEIFGKKIGIEI